MSKILIGLCAFVMLILPVSAHADTLIVTDGFLSVTGFTGGPVFSFGGDNFSLTGGGDQGNAGPTFCQPCVSGTTLRVNAFFVGSSLGFGRGIINGITFNSLRLDGSVEISGNPVLVPAATSDVFLTAPFTFSGRILGCERNSAPFPGCRSTDTVFSVTLIGQGIATIHLDFLEINANGDSVYFFRSVTYNFQRAEIPEPATIMLLTTGLISLGAKLTYGRKRKSK